MALRPTPVILTDADGAPSGGGGGASTIADGADIAEGSRADAPYAGGASGTVVGLLKGIWSRLVPAGAAASAASQPVTIATDDAAIGTPAAAAFTGGASGTLISILKGIYAACTAATPAGANNIGSVNQGTSPWVVSGTTQLNSGTSSVGALGSTSNNGGVALTSRLLSSAASTNAAVVKASAGRAYKAYGYNTSTSLRFLKLYNKATAPTVGTDTPVITRAIPPGSFSIDWVDIGYYFSAGISYALTGAVADADTTAIAAGDIVAFGIEYA